MPKLRPILLIKPLSPVALSMRAGRELKKRIDSLTIVGMTIEANATMKPTTRIYESVIEKLRLLLGKMRAIFLTSGEIASAKKIAPRIIEIPVLAAKRRKPAAAKPMITSQKRTNVLVSI